MCSPLRTYTTRYWALAEYEQGDGEGVREGVREDEEFTTPSSVRRDVQGDGVTRRNQNASTIVRPAMAALASQKRAQLMYVNCQT